jgi:putative transposase
MAWHQCADGVLLECGSPLPLFCQTGRRCETSAPSLDARASHALAACANPSTLGARHLLRHSGHLSQGPSLPRRRALASFAPRLADSGDCGWHFEAWAVFSNHYHFLAHSPPDAGDASNLSDMLSVLHVKSAAWVNKLDRAPGRRVWFNFRETRLTYQKSYFTRLNYVHQNAVRHGLVSVASQYPWSSTRWFESSSSPATVKSIYRFKIDRVRVADDFEVAREW